ncbi:hypothetical protein [Aeromonas dhakensis]|uniref:hypothetical protein n=1 Tax=Aeromonas dhakensis TaxID=196024 RepID=UPI00342CF829
MSIEDIANRMYGAPPQSSQTTSEGAPADTPARTTEQLAEALYGGPNAAKPEPAPKSDATSPRDGEVEVSHEKRDAEQLAADAYPEPGELPQPVSSPDLADIRNDPSWAAYPAAGEKEIPPSLFEQTIGQDGITAEHAAQATAEMRAAALDLSLTQSELQAVKAGFERAVTSDRENAVALREHAVSRLNTEHGDSAALAFRCARAYVAANPRLAAVLDATNAGDDPEVVATIARKALALHRAGKLKV